MNAIFGARPIKTQTYSTHPRKFKSLLRGNIVNLIIYVKNMAYLYDMTSNTAETSIPVFGMIHRMAYNCIVSMFSHSSLSYMYRYEWNRIMLY